MQWFKNFKTSVKLTSAFVFIALLTAVVGLFGLNSLKQMNVKLDGMYKDNVKPIQYVMGSSIRFQTIRLDMRNIAAEDNQANKDALANQINELQSRIEENIRLYGESNTTQEEKALIAKFPALWNEYKQHIEQALKLSDEGRHEQLETFLYGDFKEAGDRVSSLFDEMVTINVELADHRSQEGEESYQDARIILLAVVLAAFIIAVGLGLFIARMISSPLKRAVRLVEQVADGDLTETMEYDAKDEIGKLIESVTAMILSLRSTVTGVIVSAESVSAAAQQISASTEEVASGSADQANAVQSINELFSELTTAMHSVARIAEQAAELSGETMSIAEKGGKVIHASVEGMDQVNQQVIKLEKDSNRIGDIIEVIDDIAEQTNLLALNAAIEAARAGDQGRGFAVVADEVRKLAERSSEATKQITLIIKGMQENTRNSVKAVGNGVALSRQTGEALESIIYKVNESVDKVTEIAAASQEQAAQSSEVLMAVQSISAVSEESAASSEETASTAQSLAGLAEELNQIVSKFKVNS
ncbi:methyl-accepting chemotaxis protein [Paenibacillus sp. DMB20]|uniref:methyl-accepting chemotaxis protein n=1 Tax=Paenibacillus sp. DMB20 TaxID=1642570 RepID=UPI000627B66E|nr:methyl-accepting chemotaxis protein [Paenibacillus sp. DMB20]KKO54208.1 chemotaxis protein [Paenibacillus sp. DMB20]